MKTIKSAREAIHEFYTHQWRRPEDDAELLKVRVQYTAKGGSGCMWLGMKMGDLVRPLNRLKALPYAWAMFAYATEREVTSVHIRLLVDHATKAAITACSPDLSRLGMVRKMDKLAEAVLEDHAHRDFTRGRVLYNQAQLMTKIGVNPVNYERDWAAIVEAMRKFFDRLCAQSLAPISQRIQEEAEDNRKLEDVG